jgi:hypothetical protein
MQILYPCRSSPASLAGYSPTVDTNNHKDQFFRDHVALVILERQSHDFSKELKRHPEPSYMARDVLRSIFRHGKALPEFRDSLFQDFKLNIIECVPADALRARLRAKYFETMYRIYEPFLKFALYVASGLRDGLAVRQVIKFEGESLWDEGDICRIEAIATMEISMIDKCCKQCIKAATQSAYGYSSLLNCPSPVDHQGIAYA